ncbi:MAG: hypothetical protein Mars2KO_10910 [Maribacter sp.]
MKIIVPVGALLLLSACTSVKKPAAGAAETPDFTIAFGSCNKIELKNLLWDDVLALEPDVWIWGGDNVYADTDDMEQLRRDYTTQNAVPGYKKMKKSIPVIGTWDDHDYGVNDGGVEFEAKKGSQAEFLDFMEVPQDSPRRLQEGVYTSHDYYLPFGSIKVIVLDTRYFRTALTPDTETDKRVKPNVYGQGSVLGEAQWNWLETTLKDSKANFNVIVSSIQFLSNEHGFECWGNFPHEVDRLKNLITDSKARGVLFLSGDRHISEFSKTTVDELEYPIIDFTSSGLTHAYSKFNGEPNPFRVGSVISTESFGLVRFNFFTNTVNFMMVGDDGVVFSRLEQSY